ncbi:glutamate--tRNA ligase [Candidatus Sumerlaeota bacterium]|nr:glutamate--tRNA ligase [Candidatus Sumerlaeota bacterium]
MPDAVCVRFAPSPTGFLHVGGVRTALFNWLFARGQGGRFLLRIEDTDRERSRPEFTDQILESLKWLGLDWDGEPVHQSQRGELHRRALDRMLAEGTAFRCFVPLEAAREAVERAKQTDGQAAFFSPDRDLDPDEARRRADTGEPHVIRFRCPEGETVCQDLIVGEVRVDHRTIGDIVLARSDGAPTYNFVVVVDDSDMGITHVIRGMDHISNTPKQILIFQALGLPVPRFAHIPLINGPDKRKLSKRHGAVTTDEFMAMGILPEAMVNYMALLGWSPGDDREIFTRDELIEAFSLERVGKSAAVFDPDKLRWLNGVALRALDDEAFVAWARSAPALQGNPRLSDTDWFASVALMMKERASTWEELVHLLEPFLSEEITFDDAAVAKHLGKPTARPVLEAVTDMLEGLDELTNPDAIEQRLRDLSEKMEIKFGLLVHPCRVALTGRDRGAGLTEVMVALGRDRCVRRLREGMDRAGALGQ